MVPPKLNYPLPPYPNIVAHSSLLLSSFRAWMGRDLIETPPSDPAQAAIALFKAPCVVLSHGVQDEPILNYGNLAALRLWEMSWDEFTSFPSRATAEPMDQAERARFLKEVTESGYVENYSGIRISKSGRCFRIENAVVWNLIDQSGIYRGQAASFMPT